MASSTNESAQKSSISIDVSLDENKIPTALEWEASDGGGKGKSKAMMLSMWDEEAEHTMRIDLWTKEMSVYDMQRFFHQSILTMSDTYERATGQVKGAAVLRELAEQFAKTAGIKT